MKWKDVNKELPKQEKQVLVWKTDFDFPGLSDYSLGIYEKGRWRVLNGLDSREIVTHWMPIPSTPEIKINCPECLEMVWLEELMMFGCICEQCEETTHNP